ncbi:hypothetical protein DPMN_054778 [Dreissena polymorpha]|uniref:Uncharacterized protein n=1 Tax=Dreissena polymorpha TaxID=45954 RepID=A0A9D4HRW4_DREPO|nr:hypothetical protein DPMN_054778 [Dreissena polymorpha]
MRNVMYLVVQDGLDEWSGKEAMPSMDGIPKDHCIVLTTSRPWKLADERIKNSQIDILLEVYGIIDSYGFSKRILRHLLDETKDLNETVDQFQKFLKSRDLDSISSSPMLHTLVLCTWVDGIAESLTGSSRCELFTTLLENLCKKANPQMSYFDQYCPSPVDCFSRTKYVKPNMEHIDVIAKAAFSFLFSNEKETSLVFSDINLSAHLSEGTKQFALHSGLISKRKSKKCYDNTSSFVHKTVQEFFAALHISNNTDVIDNVIWEYLKINRGSYLDISQVLIFLCGFNILAANKLSALMNQVDDVPHCFDHYGFRSVIISGYTEAAANKNTPIDLHLSHFEFDSNNDEDLIRIFALNTTRARSLHVKISMYRHVTIRSQDASSSLCQGPGTNLLAACDYADPSTRGNQKEVRSSASCMEFDLSACHNLEQLLLESDVTVLPNALAGLKKLKDLIMCCGCKCEALDMSHNEHIESIYLAEGVTLLPHSITNYKNLKCIKIFTSYELDLSMFENLNLITISKQVKVLPKQLLIHNIQELNSIGVHDFDFNRCDNKNIHTWCLLNGADPALCAAYTPVLPSIKQIELFAVTCSSNWLRSLLTTLLTLDHKVACDLKFCDITSLDQVKTGVIPFLCSPRISHVTITTDLNSTCAFAVCHDSPGLWETLIGLGVKNLSISGQSLFSLGLDIDHVSSMSRSLATLEQLETLRMHLSHFIDLLLPLSLYHVTVCYDLLYRSEFRQLVNKLSLECRYEFVCGRYIFDTEKIHYSPSEEYIPILQELEALQNIDVKRFRIYDWTPSTSEWFERDSVVDDGDHGDKVVNNEFGKDCLNKYAISKRCYMTNWDGVIRISMRRRISIRPKINCV